jgi:hypothetical protein
MNNELNFAASSQLLNKVLYPVAFQPIMAINKKEQTSRPTSRYKAIVNLNTKEIISVVSNNYKLLSNTEALKLAKETFTNLFPKVKPEDLIPFKVIAPATLASCHIDLIHKEVKLSSTKWEQDTWYPFLRMSNSYNRTLAFSLELGFVRKLCSNGVIFNKKTIEVKFSHDKLKIEKLSTSFLNLQSYYEDFVTHIQKAHNFKLNHNDFFLLVCKALNLSFNLESKSDSTRKKELERLEKSRNIIQKISTAYINEQGENAYALFNTLTDFVSHQDQYKTIRAYNITPNTYYRRTGEWLKDFLFQSDAKDFSIKNYINNSPIIEPIIKHINAQKYQNEYQLF